MLVAWVGFDLNPAQSSRSATNNGPRIDPYGGARVVVLSLIDIGIMLPNAS